MKKQVDQNPKVQIGQSDEPVDIEDLSEEQLFQLGSQIEFIHVGRKKALWRWSKQFYFLPMSIVQPITMLHYCLIKLVWRILSGCVMSFWWALKGEVLGVKTIKKPE